MTGSIIVTYLALATLAILFRDYYIAAFCGAVIAINALLFAAVKMSRDEPPKDHQ